MAASRVVVPFPQQSSFESMPQPHAYSFEDQFASKTSLKEGYSSPEGSMSPPIICEDDSDDDLSCTTIIWESYQRDFVVNGQVFEKPAQKWQIFLKDGPPEGCNKVTYHKEVLKQVVGSDADEVYEDFVSETVFLAVLTDEEHDKLIGLKEVTSTTSVQGYISLY